MSVARTKGRATVRRRPSYEEATRWVSASAAHTVRPRDGASRIRTSRPGLSSRKGHGLLGRMRPVLLRRTLFALTLAAAAASAAPAPPSPETVLGFRPGADRQLADWTQIVDYFRRLDAASDRVTVEEVGRTTEDRPFLVAVITSEKNMAR